MSDNNKPASNSPDPFDPSELAKLRLSQDFSELNQIKPMITSVACRKPHKQEFIRVREGEENRFTTGAFTDKDSRETYLVSPAVRDHLVGDVVPTMLVVCISRNSPIPFLWPLSLRLWQCLLFWLKLSFRFGLPSAKLPMPII